MSEEEREPTNVARYYDTLPEAMEALLPKILKPDVPMKGDEIIGKLQLRLRDKWADASIRYHLSNLSDNPSSCVEKYCDASGKRRQGFVLRPKEERLWTKNKQKIAREVIAKAEQLNTALLTQGEPYVTYWKRISELQSELWDALNILKLQD